MKNKLVAFIVVMGVIFQFSLLAFLCYMAWFIFVTNGELNEMIVGALLGLMTGVGLSSAVSYLLSSTEELPKLVNKD